MAVDMFYSYRGFVGGFLLVWLSMAYGFSRAFFGFLEFSIGFRFFFPQKAADLYLSSTIGAQSAVLRPQLSGSSAASTFPSRVTWGGLTSEQTVELWRLVGGSFSLFLFKKILKSAGMEKNNESTKE